MLLLFLSIITRTLSQILLQMNVRITSDSTRNTKPSDREADNTIFSRKLEALRGEIFSPSFQILLTHTNLLSSNS